MSGKNKSSGGSGWFAVIIFLLIVTGFAVMVLSR